MDAILYAAMVPMGAFALYQATVFFRALFSGEG